MPNMVWLKKIYKDVSALEVVGKTLLARDELGCWGVTGNLV